MAKITGLHSASIFVADVPGTAGFYISKLGFAVEEQTERMTMLRAGDFRLLVHVGGPESAPPELAMHLHLWVDDIDEFYQGLVEAGLDLGEAPEDRRWGLRTFHVRDPNGYEWEFVEELPASAS